MKTKGLLEKWAVSELCVSVTLGAFLLSCVFLKKKKMEQHLHLVVKCVKACTKKPLPVCLIEEYVDILPYPRSAV